LEAYTLAIEQGADIIEPDLVLTKDNIFVVRHENEISTTTNIDNVQRFETRKTSKFIDGVIVNGFFTEDFTLAELMELETKERIPDIRPKNTTPSKICTFQQVIDLAKEKGVGIYPELKHPSYFKSIGKPMENQLIDILESNGLNKPDSPVFIQCFEPSSLIELRPKTPLKLVMLIDDIDHKVIGFIEGFPMSNDLVTPNGLSKISEFANVVGCNKQCVIRREIDDKMGNVTNLVENAHSLGLMVHIWTLRPENKFLPNSQRYPPVTDGSVHGDLLTEIRAYLAAGIDGFFTDAPDYGRKAIDSMY
jgi:glycerophosphoryl diester phosphodiesterase